MVHFLSRNASARIRKECVLVVFHVKWTKSNISLTVLWIPKRTNYYLNVVEMRSGLFYMEMGKSTAISTQIPSTEIEPRFFCES